MENRMTICAGPGCTNTVTRYRTCGKVCSKKVQTKKNMEMYKGIHKDMNGGPRSFTTAGSIKKDEVLFMGSSDHLVSDFHVDDEILDIAIQNHEANLRAREDYEYKVVFDGLKEFKRAYDDAHDISYTTLQSRKYQHTQRREDYLIGAKNKRDDKRKKEANS